MESLLCNSNVGEECLKNIRIFLESFLTRDKEKAQTNERATTDVVSAKKRIGITKLLPYPSDSEKTMGDRVTAT